MAYDITLEGKNLAEAELLLKNISSLFDKSNISYWLEGGTLLGIRREGRLLPWDNDVDISIMEDQSDKLDLLLASLKNAGYRIRIRKFQESSEYFKKGAIRMIKIRNKSFFGLIKGKVCLDIFVKYAHSGLAFWEIDNKTKSVPEKFYKTFKKISFKEDQYSIPQLTDEYLSYRYGNWETPKKDWDTSRDDQALN
ncbi:LicD family protein [Muriicola sp. Z0-33]|uniref:LicD family protein n=1 Tax=Muriicola sp. Z0-33 TaxID=2816957 RepID=UPI0022379267|nr:LicD family protein [Muriicola sp. Z0-33]MCW5515956.1 LicD family protein [Muriicola sp. Z0-33]